MEKCSKKKKKIEVFLSIDENSDTLSGILHDKLILDEMAERQSILDMDPGYKESISNMEGPEVTVICVDNSFFLTSNLGGGVHKPQAKAIVLYAEKKIDAHLENEVCLLAMGAIKGRCWVPPTRDLDKIRAGLKGLEYAGQPFIPMVDVFSFFLNSEIPKRRLLVFYGGRLHMGSAGFSKYANQLKKFNIAVDVVNFGLQCLPPTKHKLLEEFAADANNDDSIHYLYAPSGSTTSLGDQILRSRLSPGGLPMQEEKKKEEELKLQEKKKEKALVKEQKMLQQLLAGPVRRKTRAQKRELKKEEREKKKEQKLMEERKKKEQKLKDKNKKRYEKKKKKKKMLQQLLAAPGGLPVLDVTKKEEEVNQTADPWLKKKMRLLSLARNGQVAESCFMS